MGIYILIGIIWAFMSGVTFAVTYDSWNNFWVKMWCIFFSIVLAPLAFGIIIGSRLKDF